MRNGKDILLVHDGDPIGISAAAELAARDVPVRQLPGGAPHDELVQRALGCRALVAVGTAAPTRTLLAAAEMPGVRALVLVLGGAHPPLDLPAIKRSGVPYTVLRAAPLIEELARALEAPLAAGRLTLARDGDPEVSWVAARDVARCAIAAIDADDACGRIIDVAAPGRIVLSELASRLAAARGRQLKVSRPPRWALPALRPFGRRPFELDGALRRVVDGGAATSLLPGSGWGTIDDAMHGPPGNSDATPRVHVG